MAEQSRRPLQLKETTIKTLEKTLGTNPAYVSRKPIMLKNRRIQIQNEDSDDDEQVRMILNPRQKNRSPSNYAQVEYDPVTKRLRDVS